MATAGAAASIIVGGCAAVGPASQPATNPSFAKLPRWRGFNLLEKFGASKQTAFHEEDFDIIAGWGFNFVRLPMSYRCWGDWEDYTKFAEKPLKEVDQAVEFGRQRGIHVNLCFHRAPGYCVNPPKEPHDLWTEEKSVQGAALHWRTFAQRYKGIPSSQLSFDLVNEPPQVADERYLHVARAMVEAIREVDPDRLIIADGSSYGNKPVHALVELKIAQSTRGYAPLEISHYKASWMAGSDTWAKPTWPLGQGKDRWDKARLLRDGIGPWQALEKKGIGIHVGEWGVYNFTPHDVALAWMADSLDLWKSAGWGWALWNLRGSFGVLDSGRADVTYEDFKGHKLDRKMLEMLRERMSTNAHE